MDISLRGYGESVATFQVSGNVTAGTPVKISANGTVSPCAAKDKFCGVALSVRGGYAAVQTAGYIQAPYAGTKPAVGYQTMNADGTGKVQAEASGRLLLVTDVDDPAGTCGILLA
ncbi:hypothetical protein [Clostridium sp. D33t1_170424_F3]|uniref:hypothetical protein n=1 Tax=Clostridium sp. D33t1_170424_F3 TaxID=2787099 RepID=UPI0018AB94B9|nr:hypothetical protein [Clostridium sp. D33t1_170424_F3]